jgi:FkbM family methyltransferase
MTIKEENNSRFALFFMKMIHNYKKRAKILGFYLALADFFNLLNGLFYLKKKLRMVVKDSSHGLDVLTIVDTREELFRAKRIFTKEPGTIEWIENNFRPGEMFYDIGANIGVFSLFSAKKINDLKVFAFEPLSLNYAKLNENIIANRLDKQVTAYNIALNDRDDVSNLYVSGFYGGASGSQCNSVLDSYGHEFRPQFVQGIIGFSLDSLIRFGNLPVPNHIKIDVDGNEYLIIRGAEETLGNPAVRTVLVELVTDIDDPDSSSYSDKLNEGRKVVEILKSKGFVLKRIDIVGQDLRSRNHLFIRG